MDNTPSSLTVNEKNFKIIKLLGHGKGGYSYLAQRDDNDRQDTATMDAPENFSAPEQMVSPSPAEPAPYVVLKQIHHEPCSYYTFGDKIQAEENDYGRLKNAGIRIPEMFDIDRKNERIVKEYIEGKTIFELVKEEENIEEYLTQVRDMAECAKNAGLNIDYFPTNFVIQKGLLYYIDYECNNYMEEWNFENWGIKYWSKTPEFLKYLEEKGK